MEVGARLRADCRDCAAFCVGRAQHELLALVITLIAASRFSMLPTVLIAVASSGLLGYWMN